MKGKPGKNLPGYYPDYFFLALRSFTSLITSSATFLGHGK
jgi:hypothetical protein